MKRVLIASLIAGVAVTFAGCGRGQDFQSPSGPQTLSDARAWTASGAQVDSAHLLLHVRMPGGEQIVVHPANQPWSETTVTWNAMGPWVSPFVIAIFAASDSGMIKIDVTTLVNGWFRGTRPNDGIMLDQNPPYIQRTWFDSREAGAMGPKLMIYLSDADSTMVWTLPAAGDAYVDENRPDVNLGFDSALYCGYETGFPGETRTLLAFDPSRPLVFASLGDQVWHDLNANGIQEAGEPGVAGVAVNLLDCSMSPLASTVTSANGSYRFDSLGAGSYSVEVVLPAGYLFSPGGAGTDPLLDSDVDPLSGRTNCIALLEGQDDRQWDAGLVILVSAEPGCTHTSRYWRKHAGFRDHPDEVTALLPIWLGSENGAKSLHIESARQARSVLYMFGYGHPFNGITRLYAQLFAAKLNIAAGASPDAIAALLADVDAFLAENSWREYRHLDRATRKKIWLWKMALWQYNAGKIGPGSCDDQSEISQYSGDD